VRTRTASESTFNSIRAVVRQIDPDLPVMDMRTVEYQLDRVLLNERLLVALVALVALAARRFARTQRDFGQSNGRAAL